MDWITRILKNPDVLLVLTFSIDVPFFANSFISGLTLTFLIYLTNTNPLDKKLWSIKKEEGNINSGGGSEVPGDSPEPVLGKRDESEDNPEIIKIRII